ncbi:hypothetical protein N8524_10925 [Candidatus Puniceispirillum sp.]|nr:hypothetical protein [Candidatus Puniceispirillum sp.]
MESEKNSLVYIETNVELEFYKDPKDIGPLEILILSLQRYLIRNTEIKAIEIVRNDSYEARPLNNFEICIRCLCWAPKDYNTNIVSKEFVGAINKLTEPFGSLDEIHFGNAFKLYEEHYLKENLSEKHFDFIKTIQKEEYSDFQIENFYDDWCKEAFVSFVDQTTEPGTEVNSFSSFTIEEGKTPNQFGLFSWIFLALKSSNYTKELRMGAPFYVSAPTHSHEVKLLYPTKNDNSD